MIGSVNPDRSTQNLSRVLGGGETTRKPVPRSRMSKQLKPPCLCSPILLAGACCPTGNDHDRGPLHHRHGPEQQVTGSARPDTLGQHLLFSFLWLPCGVTMHCAASDQRWGHDEWDHVKFGISSDDGLGYSQSPTTEETSEWMNVVVVIKTLASKLKGTNSSTTRTGRDETGGPGHPESGVCPAAVYMSGSVNTMPRRGGSQCSRPVLLMPWHESLRLRPGHCVLRTAHHRSLHQSATRPVPSRLGPSGW